MKATHLSFAATVFGAILTAASPAFAQGTAFTCQGRFNDGANPANGSYDLRFTIYNPAARHFPSSVWSGTETIIWGGDSSAGYFRDVWSYTPGKVMLLYQKP